MENVHKHPSASSTAEERSFRIFGQGKGVHEILGGGKTADVLLWREKHMSAGILIGATVAWVLFHWLQYTLLSVCSNLLLFVLVILFAWSNATSLLNRPPPPIPQLQLSEETVRNVAGMLCIEINKALLFFRAVALGKDVKFFLKVSVSIWILSVVGGWFNFLTLMYIGLVFAHIVPFAYDRYENEINSYAKILLEEAKKQYKKIDELVLSRIPKASQKDKKKI